MPGTAMGEAAAKHGCSQSGPRGCTPLTFLFHLLSAAAAVSATDTILPGAGISGTQTLVSKNGDFELGFFTPGAGIHGFLGIRFKRMPSTSPTFWVGERVGISDLTAAALEVFNCSLCIMEAGSTRWCSPVAAANGPSPSAVAAVLLGNGNLVVNDQANASRVLWQSFDSPGDSLLPGARLGLAGGDTGANVSLTYRSYSHNGSVSVDRSRRNGFVLTTDDHPSLGTFPDWMVTSQDNGRSLVLNPPDKDDNPNQTEFLQFLLGQVSLMRWSEDSTAANNSGWVARWTFPSDCKSSGFFCGNFGACTNNDRCDCIDGFEPSYPAEWSLGSFATGCSRPSSLPLSCETDGQTEHDDSFILLDKLQGLPYDSQNDSASRSDEDCKQACLSKCYCVAYVYDDSGCKVWYYNLYNVSFASRPPYSKVYVRWGSKLRARKGFHTWLVVFLVIGGLIALASAILVPALLWRYRRDLFTCRNKFEVEGSLVFYSYAQVKKATRNFSDKLGEGGFGSVFRGTMMPGSTAVAVKSLKHSGQAQADKQFRAEVQTVGVIKHTNLVRLLGFCIKGDMRMLIYEYMPNGSLDAHLFSERSGLLNWELRFKIALGIAKGLAYLHEECEDCIIHCDIKPENILLDAEFHAKISDFGMAKLLGREFNSALTTIRGTMGYLAPEWISGQPITKKADVYSFGIVLLEIISGRRTTKRLKSGSHRYFPLYAAAQVNEGNVMCLLDGRMEGDDVNVKELDVACRVACWCIQDEENDRPSMGQVVRMLQGVVNAEIPPIPSSFQNLLEGENSGIYSDEG